MTTTKLRVWRFNVHDDDGEIVRSGYVEELDEAAAIRFVAEQERRPRGDITLDE